MAAPVTRRRLVAELLSLVALLALVGSLGWVQHQQDRKRTRDICAVLDFSVAHGLSRGVMAAVTALRQRIGCDHA